MPIEYAVLCTVEIN